MCGGGGGVRKIMAPVWGKGGGGEINESTCREGWGREIMAPVWGKGGGERERNDSTCREERR